MILYILQVVAFQVIFLCVYDVFLKRETFFNHNRFYLLATAILSFILPFVKLEFLQDLAPQNLVISLPEVFIGNTPKPEITNSVELAPSNQVLVESSLPIWQILLISGMVLSLIILAVKLLKIYRLKENNPHSWKGDILLVQLLKSTTAFSFFNTVFLGENISETEKNTIYKHELVHVKQWHSLDLIFFEILKVVMWFNPLIYIYQSRIKTLHEYIADKTAVKQNGKKTYYQQLLNQVFETNNMSFTNSFFNKSLIKKRIIMLQKSKSKKANVLKYALIIPVIFGMLVFTSCNEQSADVTEEVIEIEEVASASNSNKTEPVPFSKIDKIPSFQECESLKSQDEKRKCVNLKVQKFVNKNFNTKLSDSLGLSGRIKIYTNFKIDKNGDVVDVKSRAPHPGLETEAERVIGSLPKFIPGEHQGKVVNVGYMLPIVFQIND